ncbi:hypothetical protein KOW79_000492 [Hemibagrus wyckioides]|uniref:Uncharacterized protein n=1 Tax=Hemibagrus wyckioides TaxID=337641 RepID=A0A9D3P870_9TELE|nr:hypothetical protein KOW79_000492 [Hemibagrus wyckioides]
MRIAVENQGEKIRQDSRGSVIFHTVDFRADRQVPPYYWDCRLTARKSLFGTTVQNFSKSVTPIEPDFSLAKGILAYENVSRKTGVTVCYVFYTPEESDGGTVGVKEVHVLGHLLHKNTRRVRREALLEFLGLGPARFLLDTWTY